MMIDWVPEFDLHIKTSIDPGKCMVCPYCEVRFSKDKDPYNNWLAAGISIDGGKLAAPDYYRHIEPEGEAFIASGYWRHKKEHLDAIRQEIDYNAKGLRDALQDGGWSVDDLSAEDKLVRPPAGYTADHPHIEILKLKSFMLYEAIPDDVLTSAKALDHIIAVCRRIYPFKEFLHEATTLID